MTEQPGVQVEPREEEGYKVTDPLVLETKLKKICDRYLEDMD